MELLIIILLIVLNGVFAMSEAAVIAARRARLQQLAEGGDAGAQAALDLSEDPTRFLATVQIGITLIGILTGAFGGATLAGQIAALLVDTPLAPYAEAVGFGLIVLLTTYLSLIIGELVPKRLAIQAPERIASAIARPMQMLARITGPVVRVLSASTNGVLWLLRSRESAEPPVTPEEISVMIEQGIEAGVFRATDQDMVEGIFRLGNRRVSTLMTPRTEVSWLNLEDPDAENQQIIINSPYSRLPVADGDLDKVVGLLRTKDLLSRLLAGEPFDLRATMIEPLLVPESMSASRLLELFRETAMHIAFVINEYGGIEGLVTIQDILEAIVGDIERPQITQRADGSWLVDGLLPIDEFADRFEVEALPGEGFETLAGFVLMQAGHIPQVGETIRWGRLQIEVVDMDGNRIDKLNVTVLEDAAPPDQTDPADDDPGTA
ncbi:MAG: HlyC/CorC family transporter [Chloroflexi bacterium]|nr:HlyC/CorC family transporter [Chloroflexota bacterium]